MWEDPIVAEIHRVRAKMAADYNFDIKTFFADLQKRQVNLGANLVRPRELPNRAQTSTGVVAPVLDRSTMSAPLDPVG